MGDINRCTWAVIKSQWLKRPAAGVRDKTGIIGEIPECREADGHLQSNRACEDGPLYMIYLRRFLRKIDQKCHEQAPRSNLMASWKRDSFLETSQHLDCGEIITPVFQNWHVGRYLCAPWTSTDCEQLFSYTSHVLDERRNRLSCNKAEMLFFVKKKMYLTKT